MEDGNNDGEVQHTDDDDLRHVETPLLYGEGVKHQIGQGWVWRRNQLVSEGQWSGREGSAEDHKQHSCGKREYLLVMLWVVVERWFCCSVASAGGYAVWEFGYLVEW